MIGVVLVNVGTPEAPTRPALKNYLREFLTDRHVVDLPRVLWWPILHGIVLRTRPRKSARLYQKIWTSDGSPLLVVMQKIKDGLERAFEKNDPKIIFELGMGYGQPSLRKAVEGLEKKGCEKFLVLPLFPQYSSATTASVFDEIERINSCKNLKFSHVFDYHDNENYISALSDSIQRFWQKNGQAKKLLVSFHGLPKKFIRERNDPYQKQCERTTEKLVKKLQLPPLKYLLCYQSRFGRRDWIGPSTQALLQSLPQNGCDSIQVVCPGFAADCLETLEEIAISGRQMFLAAGGKSFDYIPALNNDPAHVLSLKKIIETIYNKE